MPAVSIRGYEVLECAAVAVRLLYAPRGRKWRDSVSRNDAGA